MTQELQEALLRALATYETIQPLSGSRHRTLGCGRPLGPENYLSPQEIAEETGHGLERVKEVLDRHRARLPHSRRRQGRGWSERYRWREVQAVLLEELGGASESAAEKHTTQQARPKRLPRTLV